MQQQFYFPEEIGVAQKVTNYSIVPIWEKSPVKESVRLKGIYRITATILFEKGLCACEGILIDDLDVNDGAHYFEYGSPLEVDLPLHDYESIHLQVKSESADIQSNGTLIISFTVECNLKVNEPQPQVPQVPHMPKMEQPELESKESQDIINEESSNKKYPKEESPKEEYSKEEYSKEESPEEEYSKEEEKAKVNLVVQETQQPTQHEFSFLHQLKEEYSLFSLSPQMKSDHNK